MPESPQDTATRPSPDLDFLDPLVGWIKAKRLQAPAALVLEMHRPLMPMAFPAAVMAGTFIAPCFGPDYYEKIEALRDPAVLDCLLRCLSDGGRTDGPPHAGKAQEKGAGA
jgi:hypothetical protein